VLSKKEFPTVMYEMKGGPTGNFKAEINCSTMIENNLTSGFTLDLNSPTVSPVHLDKARLLCEGE